MRRARPARIFWVAGVLATALLAPMAEAAVQLSFHLTGLQVRPPVSTSAWGTCLGIMETDMVGNLFPLTMSCYHDAEQPMRVTVRRGDPGTNGGEVFSFDDAWDPEGRFLIGIEDAVLLTTGGLYLRVDTSQNPSGELRGQLLIQPPLTNIVLTFFGDGGQQVPPVATTATARCLALASRKGDHMNLLCLHDVADAVSASLRAGAPGTTGAAVHAFAEIESGLLFGPDVPLSPVEFESFLEGRLYLRIDSTSHPEGEVRAQLVGCLADQDTLCLDRGRFSAEVAWKDFAGLEGRGRAVPVAADSGLFWFFGPDNVEMMIKVLDACGLPGFENYWVFYAATTDVELTLSVTDLLARQERTYHNSLGIQAEPILDTGAFDTCP